MKITPEQARAAHKSWRLGSQPITELARQYGCTAPAVWYHIEKIERERISKLRRKDDRKELEAAARARELGYKSEQIVPKRGICASGIRFYQVLKEYNVISLADVFKHQI